MKTEYINPFINAVNNALETMAGATPDREKPFIKPDRATHGDVTGLIGFADKGISGSVALSFSFNAISKIYEMMMGMPVEKLNDEVEDIVGELTNIVVGGAKKDFSEIGFPFHLSIPMVVSGKNHVIKHKHDNPIVVIPYSIENGKFFLEISIKVGQSG
ncbi:chemotaxis protein CheX [candidate division KSB1 bacterium]